MEETRPRRNPRSQLLFRYSSLLDVLLMLLGSTFGTVAGLALPLVIVVFGFTMDNFAGYEILAILEANNDSNSTYFCSDSLDSIISSEYLEANDPAGRNNLLSNAVHSATYYAVGIAVAILASSFLSRILWAITGSRQALRIRLSFYESVLTRQVGWYDTHSITEMPPYLSNSVPLIEKAIGTHMSSLVQDGVTFLSCFIIALIVNWELTLVTSVLIPVIFTVAIVLSKVIEKFSAKQSDALSVAGGVADEVLSSIKTVVAFGGQDKEIQRYHSHLKTLKKHSWGILILTSLTLSFLAMMILQYFALGFWYSSLLFVECSVKPGEILVVVMQVMLGTFTLAELLPELKDFLQAKGSSKAVFEIIDQGSDINALSDEGLEIDDFKGDIEFKDVTFTYPSRSDVRVLQGMDLKIHSGQTVALVGPSGCGKSTVMKLIPRLYEYNTGNVLIDDKEIRSLKVHFLRNQIGIVSQEPILFNVSIRENIAYGVKMDNGVEPREVSMEEIERAAELANAHRFISELPYKYETIVGEGGSQLSGGQKQRIAIARALVRNPKILLLDEATSALDMESERIVQEALDRAREGRTTIIIAHRLSTIQNADVIVAMDGGRVVEMGTHRELMEKHGLYYKLVMEQATEETDGDEEHRDFTEAMLQTSLQRMSVINSTRPAGDDSLRRRTHGKTLTMGLNRAMTNRARANTAPAYRLTSLTSHIEERQASVYAGYEDKTLWTYLVTLKDILVLTLKPLHWILLTLSLLAFVAAGALFTYNFVVLKGLIDKFQILDKYDLLDGVVEQTIQFAIIGGAIFILYITGITMFGLVGEQVVEGVREKSFRSMVKHDMGWYDEVENSVSILAYNLTVQAKDIFQLFDFRMGSSLRSFVTTIGVVIFSLSASWVIGLVVLPAYVFMFIGAFLQAVLAKKFADKSSRRIEEIAQVTTEYIENMPTVAMLSIEERLVNKYKDLLAEPADDSLRSAAINGALLGASKAIVYFCIGICFTVGESIYTTDTSNAYYSTLPEIFTVIVVLLLTSRMFKTAFNALPDIHKAFLSADDVMVLVRDRVPDGFGRIVEDFEGKIRFHDVKFSYHENTNNILRGLTISVEPGKTLALVGPSGSGKSTTISLLEKFYRINSGAILVDENDIKNLKPSWLRQQIALVSQEPILFDMSIADNIRYGANFREVSDNEIEEAAKAANIHEFIVSLPKGYNTVAGLRGTQLSGGQKQRIAIARALVRNPKILLLDEATSALDMESERIVQEALDRAREGRTTIIIAHRLSTIQNADCIAVLHRGKVIEQGSHTELMDKRGAYFRMHNNHRLHN